MSSQRAVQLSIRVDLRNEEASFRRVHNLPLEHADLDLDWSKKRAWHSVFYTLAADSTDVIDKAVAILRTDPEVVAVVAITEREFQSAPSHSF